MNAETILAVVAGLGPWQLFMLVVLAAIGYGLWWHITQRRRNAQEHADVASDHARGDTYEMLRGENNALLERARAAELRATEAERALVKQGDALLTMQRLLKIGATNEQLAHYFAESGLAPLDDRGDR